MHKPIRKKRRQQRTEDTEIYVIGNGKEIPRC